MERSERYDPEDLEHLMLERSFDELLAEERAYALRHLEDRAEYERMRALLHHVREDKRGHVTMDADPAVREHVLAAFRAQKQPQWRIWLNSVGGLLLPARPSSYWRPVLALGTVTALIFGSLILWNALGQDEHPVLAEVKQQEAPAPSGPTFKAAPGAPVQSGAEHEEAEVKSAEPAVATPLSEAAQEKPMYMESYAQAADVEDALDSPMMELQENQVRAMSKSASGSIAQKATVTTISKDGLAAPVAATAKEMDKHRTRTAGNAVGEAEVSGTLSDSRMAASTPAYTEDDLLGLLRAAW